MKFNLFPIVLLFFLIACNSKNEDFYLLFEDRGKVGMINYKGDVLLENEFKGNLRPFQSGMALYQKSKTSYFIDKQGRESTDGYMQATDFGNGYAFVVNQGEKISVIDTKFRVRKILDYDEVEGFVGNLALVTKDGLHGVINSKLNEIIPCDFAEIQISSNGEYVIGVHFEESKFQIFDSRGRLVLETKEAVFEPREGMIPYFDDGFGYLDMNGNKVIRAKREWLFVSPFVNGYSSYLEDGRWGVLDKDGRKIIRAKYYYPVIFSEDGLAVTAKREERQPKGRRTQYDYRFGYINIDDEEVIPFKYELALNFHKGKAFVNDGKYWFIIDKEGKQYGQNEYTRIGLGANVYNLHKQIEYIIGSRNISSLSSSAFVNQRERGAGESSIFASTIRVRSDYVSE
ncbi:MAG: WG repeat-containing protein [Cryomorphaceae bacterium]|nr:WG repeat-containing protein [Cryomorphaceae bacterium]